TWSVFRKIVITLLPEVLKEVRSQVSDEMKYGSLLHILSKLWKVYNYCEEYRMPKYGDKLFKSSHTQALAMIDDVAVLIEPDATVEHRKQLLATKQVRNGVDDVDD